MKWFFNSKFHFGGSFLLLIIVSFVVTLSICTSRIGAIYSTILLCLTILILGFIFLTRFYPIIAIHLRSLLDRKKLKDIQVIPFRWAFALNLATWSLLFLFLSLLDKENVTNRLQFLFIGTLSTVHFIVSLGISYYTTTKRFVYDFFPKQEKKTRTDALAKLFHTNDDYDSFIKTIKDNKQWDKFCNDMLYRAAIIRKANEKGYLKKRYRIKELKELLKEGAHYIDRKTTLNIYSDEDLSFIRDKQLNNRKA